jgi:serine/threonine protein kinase
MSTPAAPLSEHDLDFGPTLRGMREGLKVFERYTLVRQLGRGGMGVVWLARDEKLDLEMALKFLPENLVHDEVALDDLRRETRRCLKLTHQNIVHVFDLVDDEATAAIAMEYVEGRTLSAMRLEKPNRVFEPAEILPWLRQVCEALEYAHTKAKIVHHDLKPGNIMLTSAGEVKVMDFGISSNIGDSMSRVSKAGQQRSGGGTLPYMSPQQLMGFPPSVSDDVYSLGATIYELLTGKPPFFRGSLESQIQTLMPPSMAERRKELNVTDAAVIPEGWEQLIAICLSKESEKRPPNGMAVWRNLTEPGSPPQPSKTEQPQQAKATSQPPPIPPRQTQPRPEEREQTVDGLDQLFRNKGPVWYKLRYWCLCWALGHALVAGLVCGLASLTESVSRKSATIAEAAPRTASHDLALVDLPPATPIKAPGSPANPGTSALRWLLISTLTAQMPAPAEAAPAPAPAYEPAAAAPAEALPSGQVQWDSFALGRIGLLIQKDDPGGGLFLFVGSLLLFLLLPALHFLVLWQRCAWAGRFAIATAVTVAVSSLCLMLLADKTGCSMIMIPDSYYAWYGMIDDWVKLPLIALFSGTAYAVIMQAPVKSRGIWFVAHVLGMVVTGIALALATRFIFHDPFVPSGMVNDASNLSTAEFFLLDFFAGATHGMVYGAFTAIGWLLVELNTDRSMMEPSTPN